MHHYLRFLYQYLSNSYYSSICGEYSLDESDFVALDLPEVHEGAAASAELVVRVVLCHHDSVAVPKVKYF